MVFFSHEKWRVAMGKCHGKVIEPRVVFFAIAMLSRVAGWVGGCWDYY
jgi:hypothetical protein